MKKRFNPLLMYQIRLKNNCPPALAEAWYRRDVAIKKRLDYYEKQDRYERFMEYLSRGRKNEN